MDKYCEWAKRMGATMEEEKEREDFFEKMKRENEKKK